MENKTSIKLGDIELVYAQESIGTSFLNSRKIYYIEYNDERPTIITTDSAVHKELQSTRNFSTIHKFDDIYDFLENTRPCCKSCGKHHYVGFVDDVRVEMLDKGFCHSCNGWDNRISKQHDENVIIANHRYYTIYPDQNGGFRGYGGAEFKFQRDDKLIVSHNVWSGGEVPQHMWDVLPDNATLIK